MLAMTAMGAAPTTNVPPLLPHRPANFTERYGLLLQRDIFDANRTVASYHPTTSIGPVQAQNTFTLTGLVHEDGAYSAFIEDSRTGQTTKYRIGDVVSGGKIMAVGMDHIELNTAGKVIRVDLGQTLSGQAPTTSPTTQPSSNPENNIIEMLRERRERELHGG